MLTALIGTVVRISIRCAETGAERCQQYSRNIQVTVYCGIFLRTFNFCGFIKSAEIKIAETFISRSWYLYHSCNL